MRPADQRRERPHLQVQTSTVGKLQTSASVLTIVEGGDAAVKRLAQAIRRKACIDKADKEKVLKRDLATYINNCTDASEKAQQVDTELKAKRK